MNKEIIKLDITGMTCDHCATGIEKLLSKNEGVKEANVSYPKATCECSFDPTKTSKEAVSVLDENNEIDNNKLIDIVMGGGGGASGWKVEEVTEEVSETEFTNLAKNPKVKNKSDKNFADGKELKDYLKKQKKGMPQGGELNDLGAEPKSETGSLDDL